MNKDVLFLIVFCLILIGYPYLFFSYPSLIGLGVTEGVAVVTLLFLVLKLKGGPEKKHNYSSPKEVNKDEKPKKNPFF